MPFIRLTTNVEVSPDVSGVLLTSLAEVVARQLDKSMDYVQVGWETGRPMQFGGTEAPTAFVEVRALGLDEPLARPLSAALTQWVHESLSIAPDRVFLNLLDVPRGRWGWNGSTFG